MAFEGLADKLQAAFQKLTSRGKLTEKEVKEAMREVRMALLEADVNYLVVKDFVKRVTDRAVGEEIFSTLNAGQTVIKIVREEMTALMGGTQAKLEFTGNPPTVIMLIGLQGAGKTTLAGKLAGMLQKQGKRPMLCRRWTSAPQIFPSEARFQDCRTRRLCPQWVSPRCSSPRFPSRPHW